MPPNPYQRWLGISAPQSHYELLGISEFESDPVVIEAACVEQQSRVTDIGEGEQVWADELLVRLVAARDCLLDPIEKPHYDATLRQKNPVLSEVRSPDTSPLLSGGGRLRAPSASGLDPKREPLSEPCQLDSRKKPKRQRKALSPLGILSTIAYVCLVYGAASVIIVVAAMRFVSWVSGDQ